MTATLACCATAASVTNAGDVGSCRRGSGSSCYDYMRRRGSGANALPRHLPRRRRPRLLRPPLLKPRRNGWNADVTLHAVERRLSADVASLVVPRLHHADVTPSATPRLHLVGAMRLVAPLLLLARIPVGVSFSATSPPLLPAPPPPLRVEVLPNATAPPTPLPLLLRNDSPLALSYLLPYPVALLPLDRPLPPR